MPKITIGLGKTSKQEGGKFAWMKTHAQLSQKHGSLRKYLHDRISRVEPPRSRMVVHASDLTKEDYEFCPRERVLQLLLGEKGKDEYLNTCLAFTFSMGHAIAEVLIHGHLLDIAVGNWKCPHCGNVVKFSLHPKTGCPECGHRKLNYEEVRIKCKSSGASCGIDLFVKLPGRPKLQLVELKTMEKDGFKDLKSPLSEHRIRTSLYLRMVADSDYAHLVDSEEGIVLYVIKGFGASDPSLAGDGVHEKLSPFKEFVVGRDDATVEPYLASAKPVKTFHETGEIPEGICEVYDCKRALKCSTRTRCFSGDFKAGSIMPLGE